ncbi:uncharacterized protein LOC125944856 isoform X1 [Dermacentor silvarum]|uniref:uncharacterized protein LOC125944856 isoform X1 n=1 Tax=Dermacentor silvarum TaxID=543639 RepID=UPI0021008391|nr:uncharacterized protein LOC125944856 isoform X1 [Dermacentor silvarum]
MSEAHGYCRCCSRWFKKHAEFQKWDAEKSLLVHKILQLGQENEKLKAKIYERTIASSQELQRRYKQQLSTTLAELKSLQQVSRLGQGPEACSPRACILHVLTLWVALSLPS